MARARHTRNAHARAARFVLQKGRQRAGIHVNILVGVFAILLCIVNAVVWTVVSELPFMGAAWAAAAVGCIWLQKWSRY